MRRWLADGAVLAAALALFAALALYQLDLPGLYYDEALDAVPAVQILTHQPLDLVRDAGITVLGRRLPIMAMDYVGAVHTYILVPFFAVFGVGVTAIRRLTVGGAALTIVLAYAFTRVLFGRPVAAGASLLIAVSPSFIFWARQGIHVSSLMSVFLWGALLMFWRWRTSGSVRWLWLGGLTLGIGISTKLLFVWFVIALVALYLLERLLPSPPPEEEEVGGDPQTPGLRRFPLPLPSLEEEVGGDPEAPGLRRFPDPRGKKRISGDTPAPPGLTPNPQPLTPNPRWWGWVGAMAALLAGSWMVILYNLQTGGTVDQLGANLMTTSSGVDNRAFLDNLLVRIGALRTVLSGDYFWFLGDRPQDDLWPPALLLAFLAITGLLPFDREERPRWRRIAFLIGFLALVVLQSVVTVSGLTPTHYFALLPIPQVIVVYALWLLGRRLIGDRTPPFPDLTPSPPSLKGRGNEGSPRLPLPFREGGRRGLGPLGAREGVRLAAAALPLAALVMLAVADLQVDFAYHRALSTTGGWLSHSDAIYRLADYLDRTKVAEPVALDWGIKTSVQVLTAGRVNPKEIFVYSAEAPPFFTDLLYKEMVKPETRYVFRNEEMTVFQRRAAFDALAGRLQKQVRLETTITQRDGKPIYYVYTVQ